MQWLLPTTRSGERWRRGRRILDRSLRPGAAALHRPMLQTRARVLLSRLLTNPHQWEAHIELSVDRDFPLSLITFLNYG
jgi:cytochrome P450